MRTKRIRSLTPPLAMIVAMMLLFLISACSWQEPVSLESLQQAERALAEGRIQQAKSLLESALEIDRAHAEANFLYAKTLQAMQQFPRAYAHTLRAIALDPDNIPYALAALALEMRAQRWPAVQQRLTKLGLSDAQKAPYYAQLYAAKGEWEKALQHYKLGLGRLPQNPNELPYEHPHSTANLAAGAAIAAWHLDLQQQAHDYLLQAQSFPSQRLTQLATSQLTQDPAPLRAWLEQHPGDTAFQLRVANYEVKQGHFQAALARLQNARQLRPQRVDILLKLGELLLQMQAEPLLNQLIREITPDTPQREGALHYLQGLKQLSLQQYKAAATSLQHAYYLLPQRAKLTLSYGVALYASGDSVQAENILSKALQSLPQSSTGYLALADAQLAQGHGQAALISARKAQQLAPQWVAAALTLARSQQASKQYHQALDTITRALQQHPQQAQLLIFLGRLRLALGQPEEAESALRQALLLTPQNGPQEAPALVGLLDALLLQNKTDEALALVSTDESNPVLVRLKATIQLRNGQAQEALHSMGKLSVKAQKNPASQLLMTRAIQQTQGDQAALSYLGKPTLPILLLMQASLLGNLQRWQEAEMCYRTLLWHLPKSPQALNGLAWSLSQQDGSEQYQQALQEALQKARQAQLLAPDNLAIKHTLHTLIQSQEI